jgi:protein tyrosine phosphatase (PTP) superfamily phosphohydrolase (DUF442 family)
MKAPIRLFHVIDDRLATGAQPAAPDFAWLRAQGYDAVVNLNTPSARNYVADEEALVNALGMAYVAVPTDCSVLTPDKYDRFDVAMQGLDGKRVFVHCAANIKSSGLVHIFRVRRRGEAAAAALEDIEQLGVELEPKWQAFFTEMGAA